MHCKNEKYEFKYVSKCAQLNATNKEHGGIEFLYSCPRLTEFIVLPVCGEATDSVVSLRLFSDRQLQNFVSLCLI